MDEKSADQIFWDACQLASDEERKEFLVQACGDDEALRRKVEKLLEVRADADAFLESPAPELGPAPTLDQPITDRPGTVIERYKLLEQIGEGGFGVVFMAEQEKPVRRKVALKIVKPGMDTNEVIARFEAERQALAIMDHPNIAKVFDAGATESGRPYFVMELVRGIPITTFCDQSSLTTRERLELFAAVCQAVQHAHQKGIIHRDIKPSNVMVTLRDDRPIPKVIDFGVAKATNQRLTEKTVFTRFAQMVGTPLYMSPEQAGMSELDIDTRSDIYSLGVLLYELLTGTTPFDRQRVREAAYDELVRIIREEEPPRPSLRISTLGDTLPSVAAHRKTEPRKLSSLFRGELDWIVMKALEKDRTRRYETANGFVNDIQRYLNDEPVVACPPSAAYRFRKFAKRHKVAFATGSLVAVALLLTTAGLSISTAVVSSALKRETAARVEKTKALDERTEALKKESEARDAEEQARKEAQRQTALATKRAEALQRSTYNLELGRVRELWRAHPNQARQLLEDPERCPEDLRDFTWGFYHRLSTNRIAIRSRWFKYMPLRSVAFAPDGQTVAVCGLTFIKRERPFLLFSTETGRELSTLERDSAISDLAYSPDGTILAAAGDDGTIKLWSTQSDQIVQSLPGHAGGVACLAFARDGAALASADTQGTIRIWKPTTWKVQTEIKALQERRITKLAFSPDGNSLAAADALSVTLWDVASGQQQLVLSGHTLPINDVAFAPVGSTLATAGDDKTIRLWHPRTGELLDTLAGHEGSVNAIVFSPDGTTLASGAGRPDMSIKLWNAATHQLRGTLVGHADPLQRLAYSADGNTLLSAGLTQCITWDVTANKLSDAEMALEGATIEIGGISWGVAVAPDGSVIASGDNHGRVMLWDIATRDEVATLGSHAGPVRDVEFSPDGKTLASCPGAPAGTIKLWDMQTRLERATLEAPNKLGFWDVTFSPDGTLLASAGYDGTVRLWDLNSFREKATLTKHEGAEAYLGGHVHAVVFSPDSKTLVSVGVDRTVRLWDVQTCQERAILTGHTEKVFDIAFSPDGRTLASASRDNTVKLWDWAGARELATLVCQGNVDRVAYSPDGKTLASAGNNGKIRLWDAQTAEERGILEAHAGWVVALEFTPIGNVLVSSGSDRTIKLFLADDPSRGDQRLRRYADRVAALLRQARAFRNLKQYDQAIEYLGTALQLDPTNASVSGEMVSICRERTSHYLEQKQYDKALEDISKMIRLPATSEQDVKWISSLELRGTPEEFQKEFLAMLDRAIQPTNGDPRTYFLRGCLYDALGQPDLADDDFAKWEELGGESFDAGEYFYKSKRYEKAVLAYSRYLVVFPGVGIAESEKRLGARYKRRAAAYMWLKEYDKALADLTKAVEFFPGDDSKFTWFPSSLLRESPKEFQNQFFALVDKNIQANPAVGYLARGRVYAGLGQLDKAIADFRRAVEIEPGGSDGWYWLIDTESVRGATDDRIRSLVNEADAAAGGSGFVMTAWWSELTAQWSLVANRRSEYERICHEAAARYAESTEPGELNPLAHVCALTSDPVLDTRQLVTMIQRAVEAEPNSWKQHTMGLCLLRDGQIDAAIESFNRALEQRGWVGAPTSWLGLAIAHGAAGRQGEASDWLRKAQEWFEQHPLDWTSELPHTTRMTCQLLLREAEQLIEGKSSPEDKTTAKTTEKTP